MEVSPPAWGILMMMVNAWSTIQFLYSTRSDRGAISWLSPAQRSLVGYRRLSLGTALHICLARLRKLGRGRRQSSPLKMRICYFLEPVNVFHDTAKEILQL